MGTQLIKEQSEASVETPPPGKVALFSNSDNAGILSTKDSSDVVRPAGVGVADELATTGAAVVVASASPPVAGEKLTALTPTSAVWEKDWLVTATQVGPNYAASVKELVPVDVSAAAIQVDLPAGHTAGDLIGVKIVGSAAFACTIVPDGAETIDGDPNLVLNTDNECAILMSNGTNWMQVA